MTYDDFLTLVKVLKAAYTQDSFLPDKEAIDIWYALLKDLSIEDAKKAAYLHISKEKFPPTIAGIRQNVGRINIHADEWGITWGNVIKAVSQYGTWDREGAMNTLDDLTRAAVDCIGWDTICMSEDIGVERANFRMIYEQMVTAKKEKASLPASVNNMLGNLKMIGGTNEQSAN